MNILLFYMHNFVSLLIFSLFIIFAFSYANAYATNSLSFDQTRIVIEHSGIISCIDCPGANGASTITATLTDTSVPSGQSVTLSRIGTTNDYSSLFVKFTTSPVGSLDFKTAVGQSISVTATGFTSSSATIFATGTLPSTYNKDPKIISPSTLNCTSFGGDTDGDGICNGWENNSGYPAECPGPGLCIRNGSAPIVPYFLGCTPGTTHWSTACPSPSKADLYYEIDWMLGHKPSDDVISAVSDTFANSNYTALNGVDGITFHAQLSEELPHVDKLRWLGVKLFPGFDQLKYWWFGNDTERGYTIPNENLTGNWNKYQRSMKAQVFHYAIFAHQQFESNYLTASGIAETPGNDVLISLGTFDGKVGTKEQQKATLLHEIGHNIKLNHGGGDTIGCKPNYLSVMNPSLQFDNGTNRPLDFSRSQLATLDESSLSEPAGVGVSSPSGLNTVFCPGTVISPTGQGIDWNKDGTVAGTVAADINYCSQIQACVDNSTGQVKPGQVLNGFKDWDRVNMILSPLGWGTNSIEAVPEILNNVNYTNDKDTGNITYFPTNELSTPKIPNWVKTTMEWYTEGLISENEMIAAIQYLVQEGIIILN